MDKIAVLIPRYNEAATIEKVVRDFKAALPEAAIYVYNNNSQDDTEAIARRAGAVVRNEYRQGKGNVIRRMFRDIEAECCIMTGYRAFSYEFVKTFPVLSKGFEIETEMSIHAVDKNMAIENVVVDYRDRPAGSVSKLNTYSDGLKVLLTIFRLFRTYRPLAFFGAIALALALIALVFFIPITVEYARTGLVPNFPTLIVCGFTMLAAIQSMFTGLTLLQKNRQDFELSLQRVAKEKRDLLASAGEGRQVFDA